MVALFLGLHLLELHASGTDIGAYAMSGVDIRFQKWPDIMSDHIGSWSDMV